MKYEYQDILYKQLTTELGERLLQDSLNEAEIIVDRTLHGVCYINESDNAHIMTTIIFGSVVGIQDKNGSDIDINFNIYKFCYGADFGVDIVCKLNIR